MRPVYYGGNAEEITSSAVEAPRFWGRRAVLLVNYRGYGESEGRPGEAELVSDAIEIFEERAAVREYDGGLPRINAESAALREVVGARGKPIAREVQRYREMRRQEAAC